MILKRGIDANSKKIQAIVDMAPPRTIKEVQRLTGCLAALSRFLSRSADRSFQFFQLLRNMKSFSWTAECQQAFDDLKAHLGQLLMLAVPKPWEVLYLYLAASDKAVSAVLIQEDDGVQKPVYYVSKMLQGAEVRYTTLEKIVLALVNAARRLRQYFQSHPVVVLTNQPIKQVLLKPEAEVHKTRKTPTENSTHHQNTSSPKATSERTPPPTAAIEGGSSTQFPYSEFYVSASLTSLQPLMNEKI